MVTTPATRQLGHDRVGDKAMPQYTIGHLDRLTQLDAALSRYGGLVLTGAGYRGVGIPDCIRDGAVAAEKVIDYLFKPPDAAPSGRGRA